MKLLGKITFFVFFISYSILSGQGFYDIEHINKIEIFFEQASWDSILHEYWRAADDERLIGHVIINGQTFDSVGIRYKGYSSYDKYFSKKPLNIKLDHIFSDQSYNNVETIKLANCYRDPSMIREVLGYEIIQKYLPASRANFASVFINNMYFGLYTNPETVDKGFIEKHFHENDGVFIKGAPALAPGGQHLVGKADFIYRGEDSVKYYRSYELKSDDGWADLIDLSAIITNNTEGIEQVLNIDRALWFFAFHNLFVSLDSPLAAPRNFYLYKDRTGLFNLIPWDLNMVFGTYRLIDATAENPLQDLQQLDPLYHSNSTEYPLIKSLLQNSKYRKMYFAHMKTIIGENVLNGWYYSRAKQIQSKIESNVLADTAKFYSDDEFIKSLDQTVIDDNKILVGIAELMEGRKHYLLLYEPLIDQQPEISQAVFNKDSFAIDSTISVSCHINYGTLAELVWRPDSRQAFRRAEMYDDGRFNDGKANDKVFGTIIKTDGNQIHYYIYAENNNAAAFLPERAANEYHTYKLANDLVINEVLAKNNTVQADQNGEYDDWIELFNNSNATVSLSLYYLSDKADNLFKWQFPDTVIGPNQYLIVWMDENGSQTGLHANFKLSAEGESVFLSTGNQTIVDEIQFGIQKADISLGRYPDGKGDFYFMLPSFESKNIQRDPAAVDIEEKSPDQFLLKQNYPNPFNPVTVIIWQLAVGSKVELVVYNMLGEKVSTLVSEYFGTGIHSVEFNGKNLSSGIYYYQMTAGPYRVTKKMILLR